MHLPVEIHSVSPQKVCRIGTVLFHVVCTHPSVPNCSAVKYISCISKYMVPRVKLVCIVTILAVPQLSNGQEVCANSNDVHSTSPQKVCCMGTSWHQVVHTLRVAVITEVVRYPLSPMLPPGMYT